MGIRLTRRAAKRLPIGAALALALLVSACGGGGGGGDDAGSTPASASIGASGGSVAGPAGASVEVPAGAFSTDTPVSVTMDSTGAPALPDGLTAVGNTYTITPHGGSFGELVTLRIPKPQVTLRDNEQLMLAKAQPGGAWEVLGDTTVVDGMLTASVQSFSYVTPVVVVYTTTLQVLAPFAATVTLTCDGGSCQQLRVPPTIRVLITTNGGQLPAQCPSGAARIVVTARAGQSTVVRLFSVAITSATSYETTVGPTLSDGTGYAPRWSLECVNGTAMTTNITPRISFASGQYGGDRPLLALAAPPALQALPNGPVVLSTVFTGGAAQSAATNGPFSAPTASNQTVIEWLRSRDGGTSWTSLGQSFEIDADPQPYPTPVPARRYWKSNFQYTPVALADQNALFRVHACYTPPLSAVAQCTTGPSTQLTVLQSSAVPVITDAPRSMLIQSGQSANLTVVAGGAPTPTLQWQTRSANASGAWTDIAAATGNTLTTAALGTPANGTQYRVVATNAVGTAESAAAIVSVSDLAAAPTFTTQPASLSVGSGSDAAFAVAVHGTESMSYQWRFNGNPIAGANSAVLKLPAVTVSNAGGYSIVVSNSAGTATSAAATLTVTPATAAPVTQPPTIVTQPVSVLVNTGNTATFAVGVAGSGPFTYQWLRNAQPIAGATAAYYSIAQAAVGDAATYAVTVANAAGSATSWNVILTVNGSGSGDPATSITIVQQPSTMVQVPGGPVTFAVAVTGSGPVSYQWLKDGVAISGATLPVFVVPHVGASDTADYSVRVGNPLGLVTSNVAHLTVIGAPLITMQPAAVTVAEGASPSFSVTATGTSLRYQWTRNGIAIGGATLSSFTAPAATGADAGAVYGVVVYNGAGAAVSQGAVLTLTVTAPPPGAPAATSRISGAFSSTCGISATGGVLCWGANSYGELGRGSSQPAEASPAAAIGLTGVTSIGSSSYIGCAVYGGGRLACWGGYPGYGQFMQSAVPFTFPEVTNAALVRVANGQVCTVDGDRRIRCRGETGPMKIDGQVVEDAVDMAYVSAGPNAGRCVLLTSGDVRCAEYNGSAELVTQRVVPLVRSLSGAPGYSIGTPVCVVLQSGSVRCWGTNANGLLGSGNADMSVTDATIPNIGPALQVALGTRHACALMLDGTVSCWGSGYLGNGSGVEVTQAPRVVNGLAGIVEITAGYDTTCALRGDGAVLCWGDNASGSAGIGTPGVPVLVPTPTVAGAVFMH